MMSCDSCPAAAAFCCSWSEAARWICTAFQAKRRIWWIRLDGVEACWKTVGSGTFSCKQINVARSLAMRWRWCRLPFKNSRAWHPKQTKRREASLLGWENIGCKLWTHCKYIDKHRMSCSSPSCESIFFRFYNFMQFLYWSTCRIHFQVSESSSSLFRPLSKCLSTCVLHDETSPLMIRNRNKSHMLSLGVQRSRRPKQLRFVVKSWRYCILMTRHKDSMFLTVKLPGDSQILR